MERAAEIEIHVILDEFKFRRYRNILAPHVIVTLEIFFHFSRHWKEDYRNIARLFFFLNTTNLATEASRESRSILSTKEKRETCIILRDT